MNQLLCGAILIIIAAFIDESQGNYTCYSCEYSPMEADGDNCLDPFDPVERPVDEVSCAGKCYKVVTSAQGSSIVVRGCYNDFFPTCDDCMSIFGMEICYHCCEGDYCNAGVTIRSTLAVFLVCTTAAIFCNVAA